MRNHLVAGNWKMNGDLIMSSNLIKELVENLENLDKVTVMVCPPFPILSSVSQQIQNTSLLLGSQNLSEFSCGAYTGETSALMLKDVGCHYVIIGHSERRIIMQESNEMVAAKFVAAVDNDLIPIICIGETLEEKEKGLTKQVIQEQLNLIVNNDNIARLERSVIAYEPVLAIGSGLSANPGEAQDIHAFIRSIISSKSEEIAAKIQIIYGGSVTKRNASELFSMPDIDGGLIGGASLDASEFLSIAKAINK